MKDVLDTLCAEANLHNLEPEIRTHVRAAAQQHRDPVNIEKALAGLMQRAYRKGFNTGVTLGKRLARREVGSQVICLMCGSTKVQYRDTSTWDECLYEESGVVINARAADGKLQCRECNHTWEPEGGVKRAFPEEPAPEPQPYPPRGPWASGERTPEPPPSSPEPEDDSEPPSSPLSDLHPDLIGSLWLDSQKYAPLPAKIIDSEAGNLHIESVLEGSLLQWIQASNDHGYVSRRFVFVSAVSDEHSPKIQFHARLSASVCPDGLEKGKRVRFLVHPPPHPSKGEES